MVLAFFFGFSDFASSVFPDGSPSSPWKKSAARLRDLLGCASCLDASSVGGAVIFLVDLVGLGFPAGAAVLSLAGFDAPFGVATIITKRNQQMVALQISLTADYLTLARLILAICRHCRN